MDYLHNMNGISNPTGKCYGKLEDGNVCGKQIGSDYFYCSKKCEDSIYGNRVHLKTRPRTKEELLEGCRLLGEKIKQRERERKAKWYNEWKEKETMAQANK